MKKDYSRFHVEQERGKFHLLDQQTGWCWKNVSEYRVVLAMMNHILEKGHDSEEYKRLRKLDGPDWEQELT